MEIPIITAQDAESAQSMLVYLVGVLTLIIIITARYLYNINNNRIEEKVKLIESKNEEIKDLQNRLEKEIEYVRDLGNRTLTVVKDSTTVLNAVAKEFDKIGSDVPEIKRVVKTSDVKLNDLSSMISDHIINRRNTDV